MKGVIFYEPGQVSMEQIMTVYPRHKMLADQYAAEGLLLAIGTFANPQDGSMGVFINKDAAEKFVAEDPFVLEKIVGKVIIREWNESLL